MSDRLVQGVGVNDAGYRVAIKERLPCSNGKRIQKEVWMCPYYSKWKSMLVRCYSTKYHQRRPTYKDCSVCNDWLLFSNFRKWVEEQPDRCWEEKNLDKDLLLKNNQIYSPETCVFLSDAVNNFIAGTLHPKGTYMLGVSFAKGSRTKKFMACCSDPLKRRSDYIGRYMTEEEAHLAWKTYKYNYALELADLEADLRVREALISLYK